MHGVEAIAGSPEGANDLDCERDMLWIVPWGFNVFSRTFQSSPVRIEVICD
jgi:hypothetical protein